MLLAVFGCLKPERLRDAMNRGSAGRGEEGPGLPCETVEGERDPAERLSRHLRLGKKQADARSGHPECFQEHELS